MHCASPTERHRDHCEIKWINASCYVRKWKIHLIFDHITHEHWVTFQIKFTQSDFLSGNPWSKSMRLLCRLFFSVPAMFDQNVHCSEGFLGFRFLDLRSLRRKSLKHTLDNLGCLFNAPSSRVYCWSQQSAFIFTWFNDYFFAQFQKVALSHKLTYIPQQTIPIQIIFSFWNKYFTG